MRSRVAALVAAEIVSVFLAGIGVAALLSLATVQLASTAAQLLVRMT